jgi:sugar phosphate isomerase/epimerase
MNSRRRFLGTLGASLAGVLTPVQDALAKGAGRAESPTRSHPFRGPLGLELYSLRNEIKPGDEASVRAALRYTRQVGYTEIEAPGLYGLSAQRFRALADEEGLPITSMMAGYDEYVKNIDAVAERAHALGSKNIVNAWIPHNGPFTLEICRETAKLYNQWGKKLRAAELRFGYHPHGYEFTPNQGKPLFDTLVEETDPEYVDFEMDIFWIVDPGADPVAYLKKYPTRWRLMHLKDMKKGPPARNYSGSEPETWDVPLGTGRMDVPAILREAERIGIKGYYVEDESPTARQGIVETLHYLKTIRF